MGKIIQFSRTRAYKIVLVAMLGLGVLFLIIGAFFLLSAPQTFWAMSMTVSADNLITEGGVRRLNVYSRTTAINVNTGPFNMTTLPVNLSVDGVGASFVTVTPTIRSGGVATLTLVNNSQGVPYFHNDQADADDRIRLIVAIAGLPPQVINVFIRLAQDDWEVRTRLEIFDNHNNTWTEMSPQELLLSDYRSAQVGTMTFRVNSTFLVWGVPLLNSVYEQIFFSERDVQGSGISLFDTGILHIPHWVSTANVFNFDIAAYFIGQEFTGIFSLVIVV